MDFSLAGEVKEGPPGCSLEDRCQALREEGNYPGGCLPRVETRFSPIALAGRSLGALFGSRMGTLGPGVSGEAQRPGPGLLMCRKPAQRGN